LLATAETRRPARQIPGHHRAHGREHEPAPHRHYHRPAFQGPLLSRPQVLGFGWLGSQLSGQIAWPALPQWPGPSAIHRFGRDPGQVPGCASVHRDPGRLHVEGVMDGQAPGKWPAAAVGPAAGARAVLPCSLPPACSRSCCR